MYKRQNEDNAYTSVVTGDYDKDGYVDLLITGNAYDGRFVKLLRNVNGERFEEMNVFEALPFDVEVNRHGLWEESGAGEDPETGDPVKSVYFKDQPLSLIHISMGSKRIFLVLLMMTLWGTHAFRIVG